MKDNLSFDRRQASNYMRVGALDGKRVSHLDTFTEAYEEAKRDTQTEDYLKKRADKARVSSEVGGSIRKRSRIFIHMRMICNHLSE